MEHLAGVFCGAAVEAVVECANDDRLPEVPDRAVGLACALEPGREALLVADGVAAKKMHQAPCELALSRNESIGAERKLSVLWAGAASAPGQASFGAGCRRVEARENKDRRTSG